MEDLNVRYDRLFASISGVSTGFPAAPTDLGVKTGRPPVKRGKNEVKKGKKKEYGKKYIELKTIREELTKPYRNEYTGGIDV